MKNSIFFMVVILFVLPLSLQAADPGLHNVKGEVIITDQGGSLVMVNYDNVFDFSVENPSYGVRSTHYVYLTLDLENTTEVSLTSLSVNGHLRIGGTPGRKLTVNGIVEAHTIEVTDGVIFESNSQIKAEQGITVSHGATLSCTESGITAGTFIKAENGSTISSTSTSLQDAIKAGSLIISDASEIIGIENSSSVPTGPGAILASGPDAGIIALSGGTITGTAHSAGTYGIKVETDGFTLGKIIAQGTGSAITGTGENMGVLVTDGFILADGGTVTGNRTRTSGLYSAVHMPNNMSAINGGKIIENYIDNITFDLTTSEPFNVRGAYKFVGSNMVSTANYTWDPSTIQGSATGITGSFTSGNPVTATRTAAVAGEAVNIDGQSGSEHRIVFSEVTNSPIVDDKLNVYIYTMTESDYTNISNNFPTCDHTLFWIGPTDFATFEDAQSCMNSIGMNFVEGTNLFIVSVNTGEPYTVTPTDYPLPAGTSAFNLTTVATNGMMVDGNEPVNIGDVLSNQVIILMAN